MKDEKDDRTVAYDSYFIPGFRLLEHIDFDRGYATILVQLVTSVRGVDTKIKQSERPM
jgi:hypothetical protein